MDLMRSDQMLLEPRIIRSSRASVAHDYASVPGRQIWRALFGMTLFAIAAVAGEASPSEIARAMHPEQAT